MLGQASESRVCSRCAVEVPLENFALHELRCPGTCRAAQTSVDDNLASDPLPSMEIAACTEAEGLLSPSRGGADAAAMSDAAIAEHVDEEAWSTPAAASRLAGSGNMALDSSTWSCEVCTLENAGAAFACGACGTSRAAAANAMMEAPAPPRPRGLPYIEASRLSHGPRGASNAGAPEGTEELEMPQTLWRCTRCTFENAAEDGWCEVCLAPRNSAPAPFSNTQDRSAYMQMLADGGDPLPLRLRRERPSASGYTRLLLGAAAGAFAGGFWGLMLAGSTHPADAALTGVAIGVLFGCACAFMSARRTAVPPARLGLSTLERRQLAMRPLLTVDQVGSSLPDTRPTAAEQSTLNRALPFMRPGLDRNRRRTAESVSQLLSQQQRDMEELMNQFVALRAAREPLEPVPTPSYLCMSGALPTHTVTAEELATVPEQLKACTICIEDFREGDELRTLPCFHRFHSACVDRWLHQNGTCPICKNRVDGCEREGIDSGVV